MHTTFEIYGRLAKYRGGGGGLIVGLSFGGGGFFGGFFGGFCGSACSFGFDFGFGFGFCFGFCAGADIGFVGAELGGGGAAATGSR